jgi:hypothetical protein
MIQPGGDIVGIDYSGERIRYAEEHYGRNAFFKDFKAFFLEPRRFTYTPLILCKGTAPPAG